MGIKKSNEQIYGRNNQVMLEMHDKIYGSLGISEQYVLNTVGGNPVVLSNPKAGKLNKVVTEFQMQGWTEQAQYEGKNLFDIASSGFPQQDKERVVFDNSDNKYSDYFWTKNVTAFGLQGGKTYTSRAVIATEEVQDGGDSAGTMWKTLYLQDNASFSMNEKYAIVGSFNANGICYTTFTLPEDISALQYVVTRVNGYSRTIFSEIMIVEGDYNESNFPEYEPYTGRAPSPSPDYPQEIVSAGKYNEDMQKWEYEITIANAKTDPDKNQTVTLTSDRPLTKWDKLEKRNGQWGWGYKSGSYTATGEEKFISAALQYIGSISSDAFFYNNEILSHPPGSTRETGFCEQLSWYSGIWSVDGKVGYAYNHNQIHMRLLNSETGVTEGDDLATTSAKIEAYVAQKYEEGNPFVFWYETAEPTFVPLSESEQEQMNELEMYIPTTVIQNDVSAQMKVTYKATQSLEV